MDYLVCVSMETRSNVIKYIKSDFWACRFGALIMEMTSHCKPFLRDPIPSFTGEKTVEIFPRRAYDPQ
jgi:hypothetical protein